MVEQNTETKRLMLSGRALMEKLAPEETLKIEINGFYRKLVEGRTKVGNRSFSGFQYRFIPVAESDPMVSITETSAGGKMIAKQIEDFRTQFPDRGELGYYRSVVEFKHVTKIKDKDTGKSKDVDFLAVRIIPDSLGKRVFIPSKAGAFKFIEEENTEDQLTAKQ